MERKQKIQELLNRLDELEARNPVGSVRRLLDEEADSVRTNLKETPTGTALKVLARGLENAQNDPRPDKLSKQLEEAKQANQTGIESLSAVFSEKLDALKEEVGASETRGTELTKSEITSILERLAQYESDYQENIGSFSNKNTQLEAEVSRLSEEIPKIYAQIPELPDYAPTFTENNQRIQTIEASAQDTSKALTELEKRLTARIGSLNNHGGNMNRNIAIGGNTSVLSRYTDINFKAGANTTITYAYNDVTKYTDVTLASSGGGGGGSVTGIIRSISTIAVNTAAGATAGTDYVYLASGTLTLTLPTSVGNSNLYTAKNIGAGVVTIATTGGETIDGSPNLVLPLQFTSVDLISNNSGNWDIT